MRCALFWLGAVAGGLAVAFGVWWYVMDKVLDYVGRGR